MMQDFGMNSPRSDTALTTIGLTASEIATSIIPALLGMAVVGLITVLMLL